MNVYVKGFKEQPGLVEKGNDYVKGLSEENSIQDNGQRANEMRCMRLTVVWCFGAFCWNNPCMVDLQVVNFAPCLVVVYHVVLSL